MKKPLAESNGFIPTLNGFGYMTAKWDEIAQACIDAAGPGKRVLDVGAAYGLTTLPLLATGATVLANDVDERHLELLRESAPPSALPRLSLTPGKFPGDLAIPASSIDALLASSVLHFLTGEELEMGAAAAFRWLKPGARFYASSNSPYVKSLARFLPVYEAALARGEPYPGLVRDVSQYLDSHRVTQLPATMHFLDPTVLGRVFRRSGFTIERCDFFRRADCAEDIRLDGREFVGLIAQKT